jgi:hypothetical protein
MNLKLRASRLYVPNSMLRRELDRVHEMTTGALDRLLEEHSPGAVAGLEEGDPPYKGHLAARRRAMAEIHRRRVAVLVDVLGREEAVERGRQRMFPVGQGLGEEARERLDVGEDIKDLVTAARVLYRVLGIHVEAEVREDGSVLLHIDRCALSEAYDATTCMLMSAADEGMIRGLNPRVGMEFLERITAGAPACLADLRVSPEDGGAEP